MKHTPGPWEYVLHDDDDVSDVTFEIRMKSRLGGKNGWESQHRIDYVVPGRDFPDQFNEARANAALIIASPDLLAALKDMLSQSGDPNATTGEFDTAAGRAYQVVAKAEGRS